MREAARVRPDLVVVEQPDLGMRRLRILVVEIERLRDTGVHAGCHREQGKELDEAETHREPLVTAR